jgi:hypothetical protein
MVDLPCVCGRVAQPKKHEHASIRRLHQLARKEPELLAYIEELEDLWDYAKRQGNAWRGIASAMGYEPNAHNSVKPTDPWLLDRISRFRATLSSNPSEEVGE